MAYGYTGSKKEGFMSVLMFVFLLFGLCPVSANTPSTLDELREYASNYCAQMLVDEGNRAYDELKMLYSFPAFGEKEPAEIMRELEQAEFFHNDSHCDFTNQRIVFSDETFKNMSADKYLEMTSPDIPVHLIVKGFQLAENNDLRVFLLNHVHDFYYEPNLTHLIVTSLETEKNTALYPLYAQILQQERYFSQRSQLAGGRELDESLKKAYLSATDIEQQASLLFLSFSFSGFRPPQPEISLLIYLIDQHYPFGFILSVFKHYPLGLIEEFTVPFKEGYGDEFATLTKLFVQFPESRSCMQALAYALLNRTKGHFVLCQSDIIHAWEQLTGIEWQGSETPFIEWYKENRPSHR